MKRRILHVFFLLAFLTTSVWAQKTVTGVVKDDAGGPLPGANVTVVGTTQGTITDADGHYSIQVPGNDAVLRFSFVGMEPQEILVGDKTVIDVTLKSSAIGLSDVVVTALGISRETKSLGYAVDKVTSDELDKGGTANYLKNLDGHVTGVNITSLSSDPTSSVFVVIRGATSIAGVQSGRISASAQPLYVIDGVPVGTGGVSVTGTRGNIDAGNFMSELNPEDIESISVLKGASATALYGSEGGNGVILITTKSGRGMKKGIGVTFNSAVTFDQVYKTLPVQNLYARGDALENVFGDTPNRNWGPYFGDDHNNYRQWDMAQQQFMDAPIVKKADADPMKAFARTGLTSTQNLAVTGNYDKGSFRLSYTNLVNQGVIPNTKTSRNTIALETSYNVTKKLKVSGTAQYIKTYVPNKTGITGDYKSNVVENIYARTPDMNPYSEWTDVWVKGYEGYMQNTPYLDFKNYLGNDDRYDRRNYRARKRQNPYFYVNEIINMYSRESVIGKVQLDWDIFDFLKLTGRTGLTTVMFHSQERKPWDASKYYQHGGFWTNDSQSARINNDIFLTFDKKFGDFSINALLGYNFRMDNSQYTNLGGKELARPYDYSFSAIPRDNLQYGYHWYTGKYSSIYGTASVGFKSMLYLDLSLRKDYVGITELEKNSSLYPGASLSWLVSETFTMPEWINLLKVRGGIAQVGYGIPTYLNVDTYGFTATWNGATVGTVGGSVVNPDILPEVNTTYEAGLETRTVDSRVNFDFTIFEKVHANQIQDIPIVSSSGFSSYRTNIGTVTSKGLEASLELVPVRTKDWEWSVSANFTKYKATVTELDPAFTEKWIGYGSNSRLRLREGEVIGNLYAKEGFWRVQNPSSKYYGMIILKQSSGTPIENDDPENRDYLGNFNPDFMMGFTTSLKYKRFSLDAVMSYRNGGVYISESMKRLADDGKDPYSLSGDNFYWRGGRSHHGGFAWPNAADVVYDNVRSVNEQVNSVYNYQINDASYWIGVYVDPVAVENGEVDPEDRNLPDQYYILNGEDPNTTFYKVPASIVGNTWDFPQTRTFSATNFKIRDIALTYYFPVDFAHKMHMQGGSFSLTAHNIYLWTKSGRNEDPETAFDGTSRNQGVARFTLPSVRQIGFKLNVSF